MASETELHIRGNLCSDIELTYTPSGVAVAHCTVASTPRYRDPKTSEWRDKDPLFLRCNLWRETAENAAESLSKGARVIVIARLKQRSYQTRGGEQRTVFELDVDEIGPSLRWARASLTRTGGTRQNSGAGTGFGQRNSTSAENGGDRGPAVIDSRGHDDPWSKPGPTVAIADDVGGDEPWAAPVFAGAAAGVFGTEPDF
ncbi:single-stranded DNA-binding protein [Nocardia sp. NPDC058518]|uniref:single-stranded DNA-binding protein n=1 Tax=Nocardia sp. NPDC058518 TaxID=3346534 RepID=UPI003662D203